MYDAEPDKTVRKTRIDNLSAFVNAMSSVAPGREGLQNFIEKITLDNTVLGDDDPRDRDGVKLMTMHTVKGLEFDRVFVTGLEEAIMPGVGDVTEEDVEEERRIFYVAVTRARKELYLSYAGKRQTFGQWNYQQPSRFLKEIPSGYYTGELRNSSQGGYLDRFVFEPRKSNFGSSSYSSDRFRPRTGTSSFENRPSWSTGVSLPPTKKSVKLVKGSEFKVGDRVVNPDNKDAGTVTKVDVRPVGTQITVKFDSGRTSIYNAAFAKLTREEAKVNWSVGDRISIDNTGSGKVVEVSERNGKTILRVKFDNGNLGIFNSSSPAVHKLP